MDTKHQVLQAFTDFIKNDTPFSFTKFGDTELFCISKKEGSGGEHFYSKEAAEDLIKAYSFLHDKAYLGDWKFNAQEEKKELERQCGLIFNPVFYDALLFHENAWLTPELKLFYNAIRESKRTKIYISNQKLRKAQFFLGLQYHINLPERNAYVVKEQVIKHLSAILDNTLDLKVMILTSCSILAKIINHYVTQRDPDAIVIDLGSAIDPLFIGNTRAIDPTNSDRAREFFNITIPL